MLRFFPFPCQVIFKYLNQWRTHCFIFRQCSAGRSAAPCLSRLCPLGMLEPLSFSCSPSVSVVQFILAVASPCDVFMTDSTLLLQATANCNARQRAISHSAHGTGTAAFVLTAKSLKAAQKQIKYHRDFLHATHAANDHAL